MATSTPKIPNFTDDSGSVYKNKLDDNANVTDRIAWAFAPHEQASPDLTVRIDAGSIPVAGALALEVAAQSTATLTAPATNPRKDIVHIDEITGAVGVATGAEAPSPVDPAIPAGERPIARINWVVSQTEILNVDLDDLRSIQMGFVETLFPPGTVMLFQQTSPPIGWTKVTTHDNKALRIVNGAVGSGGATGFTSVFGAGKISGATTLSAAQSGLPGHTHFMTNTDSGTGSLGATNQLIQTGNFGNTNNYVLAGSANVATVGKTSTNTAAGAASSHAHTLSMDLQFVDIIIAVKD